MTLSIYNTLTNRQEEFVPLDPSGKRVTFYSCGPTVYDYARFAQMLGSGATFEAVRNPEEFNPSQMIEHFELALLALGERRLAEHAARSGR